MFCSVNMVIVGRTEKSYKIWQKIGRILSRFGGINKPNIILFLKERTRIWGSIQTPPLYSFILCFFFKISQFVWILVEVYQDENLCFLLHTVSHCRSEFTRIDVLIWWRFGKIILHTRVLLIIGLLIMESKSLDHGTFMWSLENWLVDCGDHGVSLSLSY